ncbi:hypothetical protein JHK86_009659 [Glycine max]|nr:hypothetical protein JHK86_009659 [Glycine max]
MRPTYSDIGCKLALEDKERVAFRRRQRHEHVDATRHAKPCNCSSLASQQQKGHRTKEKLIQFICSSCLLCVCCPLACVCFFIKLPCRICHQALRCARKWACYGSKNNRAGFVNSLAFAKSGEFLVAGVGHVKIFSNCVLLSEFSHYGCRPVCSSSKQDFGENGRSSSFNSNILTPTINYGCHLHSSGTGITDIALHSSRIKSEKDRGSINKTMEISVSYNYLNSGHLECKEGK